MKKTLFLSTTFTFALFFGCGGKTEPTANGPTAVGTNPPVSGVVGTAGQSQIMLPTDPKEIVRVFLDAMRSGNGEQLAALFSTNARLEIQKQGIKIEPPGSAQATFVIGDAAPQGDAMLVSSLWKEPPTTAGEEPQEMEVVWELRKEAAGWRVCGMAVDPGTGEEYEVVNFEKLDEPGVGNPQAPQTRVASLPQGTPTGLPATGAPNMNGTYTPTQGLPTQGMPGTYNSGGPAAGPGVPGQGVPVPGQGVPGTFGNGGQPVGLPQSTGSYQGNGTVLPGSSLPPSNLPSAGLPSGLPQGGLPSGGLPQGGLPAGLPPGR